MIYTVQIVGVGGQGVLLASSVIGNAAINAGYDVAMSEVHGMAQRGGSVLSTVRFGDKGEVYSPLEAEGNADFIMGFEPVETVRNLNLGNRDTKILMNLDPVFPSMVAAGFDEYPSIDSLVETVRKVNSNIVTIDATKLAIEAGKAVAANAVMIGALAGLEGFPLSRNQLLEALSSNVPEKFLELNVKAMGLGYEAIRGPVQRDGTRSCLRHFHDFRLSVAGTHVCPVDHKATSEDWKNIQPLPSEHLRTKYCRHFTEEDLEYLSWGLIPVTMEDRWFIFFEGNKVYFHRSWTGYCIFILELCRDDVHVLWINNDKEQYVCDDLGENIRLLNGLLDNLILYDDVPALRRHYYPYMAAQCLGCKGIEVQRIRFEGDWEVWTGPMDGTLPSMAIIHGRSVRRVESEQYRHMIMESKDLADICNFVGSMETDLWTDYR